VTTGGTAIGGPVVVVADDLIWGTRIVAGLREAGAAPVQVRSIGSLESALAEGARAAIVDLTARAYDGLTAVRTAAAAGVRVLAVGQHDDHDLRRAALDAGAEKVVAYRLLAERPGYLGSWLAADPRPAVLRHPDGGRPAIPPERYGARLAGAAEAAAEGGIGAVLVGVGADLRYLTGYVALPLERLTMLVVTAASRPTLVVPRLEALPARGCPAAAASLVDVMTWEETEDPIAAVAGIVRGAGGAGGADDRDPARGPDAAARVAVGDRLWATFLLGLQAALPEATFGLASAVLGDLRIVKDADEVALLRAAAHAADRVVAAIASGPLVGRTEADIAAEVLDRLVAEGHDSAEFAIVAAGPDSASPHHEPGERVVRPGEPIVFDIGGPLGGYGSDITRTIWVTGGDPGLGPDDEFRRIHALVREANAAATAAVAPGVPAARIDAVARAIIEAGGYGERFIHRTGHGIGLEGHEDPYLVAGNDRSLEPGMAFSVEPGIYLEGRYGVRIEDIVVCGHDGPVVLNEAPRELLVVDG
jgi:Xaa-Pro aminopeptidase